MDIASEYYYPVIDCRKRYLILYGGRSSAKTHTIAQKMAKTTAGSIGSTIAELKQAQKDQKASRAKEKKAQANNAKWDDAMLQLKLKALGPIMKVLSYKQFWEGLNSISNVIA